MMRYRGLAWNNKAYWLIFSSATASLTENLNEEGANRTVSLSTPVIGNDHEKETKVLVTNSALLILKAKDKAL